MPEDDAKGEGTGPSLAAGTPEERVRREFAAALFDQGVSGRVSARPGTLLVEVHFTLEDGSRFLVQADPCGPRPEEAADQAFFGLMHAFEGPLTFQERRLSDWRHVKGWTGGGCRFPAWHGRPAELAAEAVAGAREHEGAREHGGAAGRTPAARSSH